MQHLKQAASRTGAGVPTGAARWRGALPERRLIAGLVLGACGWVWTAASPAQVAGSASQGSNNSPESPEEIVVTAEKRVESVVDIPETVNVLSEKTLTDLNIQSFDDYAAKIPNLSFNNGQLGRASFINSRGVTIRGVVGDNTTSLYIDDTPIPITQDPRIVDVARIEVLKGPQGTLYGSAAIGGTLRIITNQPSFTNEDTKYMVQGGTTEHSGSQEYGATFSTNSILVPDVLAVRTMGFVNHDAGYVTRVYPTTDGSDVLTSDPNTGEDYNYGGSLSALLKMSDRFTANAKLMGQRQDYPNGLPLVYRGITQFDPTSLIVDREYNEPESSQQNWYLPSLALNYQGSNWDLVSSTSYYARNSVDVQDVSEAMHELLAIPFFGGITNFGAEAGGGDQSDKMFQEEIRLSFQPTTTFNGLVGGYYSHDNTGINSATRVVPGVIGMTSPFTGPITTDVYFHTWGQDILEQKAIFGELNYKFLDIVTATAGLRRYWIDQPSTTTTLGFIVGDDVPTTTSTDVTATGYSPRFALSVEPSSETNIYASGAKGFRPGGPGATLPPQCDAELAGLGQSAASVAAGYKSDSVWSYELGAKQQLINQHVLLTGAVFDTEWKNIQQNVALNSCGISFTGNAGAARIRGAEAEITGNVTEQLAIRAGYGYTNARITNDANGTTNQAVGSRLYGVPLSNATVSAMYTQPISSTLIGYLSADWSYTGSSLSTNNSTSAPAVLGAYQLVNARIGVRKERSEWSLFVNNLTNKLADLGDSVPDIQQTTVINGQSVPYPRVYVATPRTIGLQYRQGF